MRKIGWFAASSAAILMSVALVDGQQGGKGKGGFGGFGMRTQMDPVMLLRDGAVKKELDVTDEQMEKLPAEIMVAISKVLNEKQFKRFRQVELQSRKNNVFKDNAVLSELKISDDQKKSILTVLDDSTKELAELRKGGGGGAADFKGRAEKVETINKETKEKVYNVLTKDQRKAFRDMLGEELKLEGFGGGFGGNFGKKKKTPDNN